MQVLFLGGTGNISGPCAEALRDRGHGVTVVTRGRRPVPAGCRAATADRRDARQLAAIVADVRPEVVVNFIGFELADVQLDAEVFRDVRQYIFISTAMVYAKPHRRLPLTEQSPQGNTFSDYARKKQQCEAWLLEPARRNFPVTIVRPSHTYGPGWIPNPVASSGYTFAARMEQGRPLFIHDEGQSLWTLTAASDFAVGLAGLVGRDDVLGEAYQITSDEVLTWNCIYAEIAAAVGCRPRVLAIPTDFICAVSPELTAKLRADKSEPGVFDNLKIKSVVPDFDCRKRFREGIRESVRWFRADPTRMAPNPQVDALFDEVCRAWEAR